MEKFAKQNWFKLGILVVVLLGSALFYRQYIVHLDNLKNQDQQINCSKSALTWYKNQTVNGSTDASSGYENHYSIKLGKCFATYSNSLYSGKDYLVNFFVYDVYENRLLLERHTWLNKSSEDQYIKDDAFGGGSKITKEEFDGLFKSYMEN